MKKKISLIKLVRLWGFAFLIAMAGVIVSLDFVKTRQDFFIRADQMRTDYVEHQKEMIKREVERVIESIYYQKLQIKVLANSEARSKTVEALNIVHNIYEQNEARKSDAEIKKIIVDALRPLHFNEGKNHHFIVSVSGKSILDPTKPSFEGQNIATSAGGSDELIVKNELEFLKKKRDGFVREKDVLP